MGAKTLDQNLTPKKSHAQFPSHKIFHKALTDMTRKIETLVLNTPKNPHLNQAIQKILSKIFLPKKSRNRKFQTKKILRSSLSLQIWSLPAGQICHSLMLSSMTKIVDDLTYIQLQGKHELTYQIGYLSAKQELNSEIYLTLCQI